jgi:acyl-CoA thioesterase FadM
VLTVTRLGNTAMSTEIRLEREGETVTEGELHHVFVTAGEGEKVSIPETVREGLAPYSPS